MFGEHRASSSENDLRSGGPADSSPLTTATTPAAPLLPATTTSPDFWHAMKPAPAIPAAPAPAPADAPSTHTSAGVFPLPPLPGAGFPRVAAEAETETPRPAPSIETAVEIAAVQPEELTEANQVMDTDGAPAQTDEALPPLSSFKNSAGQTMEEVKAAMDSKWQRKLAEMEAAAQARLNDPRLITLAGLPFYDLAVVNSLIDRRGVAPLIELIASVLEAKAASARAAYDAKGDRAWLQAFAHYQSCADFLRAVPVTLQTYPTLAL